MSLSFLNCHTGTRMPEVRGPFLANFHRVHGGVCMCMDAFMCIDMGVGVFVCEILSVCVGVDLCVNTNTAVLHVATVIQGELGT